MQVSGVKQDCLSTEVLDQVQAAYEASLLSFTNSLPSAWQIRELQAGRFRWRCYSPPADVPSQGWKIYLSVAAVEAVRLAEEVLPFIVKIGAAFKLPATITGFLTLNSGLGGRTQIGKTLVVYPLHEEMCRNLALELHLRWVGGRGPAVPFVLRLNSSSSVYLRYGVIGGRDSIIDASGKRTSALRDPGGILVEDRRDLPGSRPSWASVPIEAAFSANQEIARTIEVNSQVYLPLRRLSFSPKGEVLLAASGTTGGPVVIKTARPGVCGDLLGFDAVDRLENEFKILSALHNTGKNDFAPAPIGFKAGDPAILILEDQGGSPLDRLPVKSCILAVAELMRAVGKLHDFGYAHRDVKLSNAARTNSGVSLLDFELASAFGEPWPLLGTTRAYAPPEGFLGPVTPFGDRFALGVALAHATLQHDPARLPLGAGRLVGLMNLLGASDYTKLVRGLTSKDPLSRPTANEAANRLKAIGVKDFNPSQTRRRRKTDRRWIMRAVLESAKSARAFRISDGDGYAWHNNHINSSWLCGGLNIGAAGIILGLITIATATKRRELMADLGPAMKWLADQEPVPESPGLFTGEAGVALAMSVGAPFTSEPEPIIRGALDRLATAAQSVKEADLFIGAAGIILAACIIKEVTGQDDVLSIVRHLPRRLIQSANQFGDVIAWEKEDSEGRSKGVNVGAAHGAAGIALALAHWGHTACDDQAVRLALETFRSIYRGARSRDGKSLKYELTKPNPAPVGAWCHGPAGYLWCILHAFGDEPKLSECIDWAVEVLNNASLVGDPTLCHGLAGQLELCRMLRGVPRHRLVSESRCTLLAAALRLLRQRKDGLSVWSSEDPEVFTPDLWVGFIGTASALAMQLLPGDEPLLSGRWLRRCANS